MKNYLHPEIEKIELAKEDIMNVSGGELGDGEIGNNPMGDRT